MSLTKLGTQTLLQRKMHLKLIKSTTETTIIGWSPFTDFKHTEDADDLLQRVQQ